MQGGKTLFQLRPLRAFSVIKGSQGRNTEAETEAEAMEKCCLLACFQGFAQSASL